MMLLSGNVHTVLSRSAVSSHILRVLPPGSGVALAQILGDRARHDWLERRFFGAWQPSLDFVVS